MEKSSKLKIVGLTLAGLSVLASGSALAASLKVGGSVQTDFVWFDDDVDHPSHALGYGNGNLSFDNGSNLTNADIYLRGTLLDRWVYNLSVRNNYRSNRAADDSRKNGPQVLDAWVGWDRFDPFVRFSVGRMNVSQGLENTGNQSGYTFIAPAAGQRTFATGRADGVTLEGNPLRWLGYQVGAYYYSTNTGAQGSMAGTGANIDETSQVVVSNVGNHLGLVSGRAFVQPVVLPGRVLHVGGTYSFADTDGDVTLNAAPGGYLNNANAKLVGVSSASGAAVARDVDANGATRTDGYSLWGVEGLAIAGPLHVQAEYQEFELDLVNAARVAAATSSLDAKGWYVQGSWVMTGESRNYDPVSGTVGKVTPRNNVWGAWELAVRYDRIKLNDSINTAGTSAPAAFCGDSNAVAGTCINGGKMSDWTVGLNWYPNKNVKLMANYTWAGADYAGAPNFSAGTPETKSSRDVNVFGFKAQVDF